MEVSKRSGFRSAWTAVRSFSVLLCLLWTGLAFAGHAPIVFYNVTNWTPDYHHTRYATPYEALAIPWDKYVGFCQYGGLLKTLVGIHIEHLDGYEDGDLWTADAEYHNWSDCSFIAVGDVESARRWAVCDDQYSLEPRSWPGSRCPDLKPDPDKGKGTPECPCKLSGDPVNPATGNKFEIDDLYRGRGVFPLNFKIAYNSASADSPVLLANQSVVGARRTHNYQMQVSLQSNPELTSAYVLRPDGKLYGFDQQGQTWVGDPDVADRLSSAYDSNGAVSSWTYSTQDGTQEFYDAKGRLTSIAKRDGYTQKLAYDPVGNLESVTDIQGRSVVLSYDDQQRLTGLQDPDGGAYVINYDSANNISDITFPGGGVKHFVYGGASPNYAGPNNLTGVIDESGTQIDTTLYDDSGKVASTSGPNGANTTSFSYFVNHQDSGDSFTVVDSSGASEFTSVNYMYGVSKPSSVVRSCSGCSSQTKLYTYDANGRLSTSTDANGVATATTFDTQGLLTQKIEAQGTALQRTTSTTWDATLRLPTQRTLMNAAGTAIQKTSWLYNTRGQTVAQCEIDPAVASSYVCAAIGTPPAGVRRAVSTYCDTVNATTCPLVGLLLTTDGPRIDVSDLTKYTYYPTSSATSCGTPGSACHQAGDLWKITDALNHTTVYASYDGAGRVTRITDPNGTNTDTTYTPRGWVATVTIGGAKTTYTYDAVGNVTKVLDADGVFTTYTYDAAHRLTDVGDAVGNTIHYTLDNAGNKTAETVKTGAGVVKRSLGRTFNALGQLTAMTDGLNRTVFTANFADSYDANGNLVHTADALGVQKEQGYDGLNRLVSTLQDYQGTNTATQNTQTAYTYDALDNLTGVSDPNGLNTTYDFDGLSSATAVHSPDTGTATSTYNAAGSMATRTDAKGVVATYGYDAANRPISVSYADSTLNVAYRYDEANTLTGCTASKPIGRMTSMVENAVTTTYCYDLRGNRIQKRQVVGTTTDITTYTYSTGDRLKTITSPSGAVTAYTRNTNGQITAATLTPPGGSATTVVSAVAYLPFGPVLSYKLGNNQVVNRTYDANYQVSDVSSPALALHFGRDAMGNVTALGNPVTETYTYDPLYRLTAVNNAAGAVVEAYTYNRTGDRLSKTGAALSTGTYGYATGTHHISTIGSTARTYDTDGNTTGSTVGGEAFGFGYNNRNRMTVVQRNQATVGTYTYNANGERLNKVATLPTSTTTRFAYDEGSQLLGEYGSSNRDYVWLDNLPVAIVDTSGATSTISYVHADALGTPRAVSSTAAATVWQWVFASNPFGEKDPTSTGGFALNLRFPGQYYDAESRMAYNVNRDYEASTGRYLQSDPIGLGGGLSTYGYVLGNPFDSSDALGLQAGSPQLCAENPAWAEACEAAGMLPKPKPFPLPSPAQVGGAAGAAAAAAGADAALRHGEACPAKDDPCPVLYAAISDALSAVKGRYYDLLTDKLDLFKTRPTGPMSWDGHQQQFRNQQAKLRALIDRANGAGCLNYAPDAWDWATKPAPQQPSKR